MKKYDMHVHSKNSHDGKNSVEELAEAALENGVSAFAVTDHCDIQFFIERDVPACTKASVDEAGAAAEKYKGKVEILKGVELGEAFWDEARTKEILSSNDFDVIIGSVHSVRYKTYADPYSTIDFSKMPKEELDAYMNRYFDDVLEMLEKVPCDIMAHLTCPLRYINGKYKLGVDSRKYEDKICRILKVIIEKSISMEINTSGVGTGYGEFMPDEWIIGKFAKLGGYLVTLGSDAHTAANVGKDIDAAIELLKKYGFKSYYYYKDRKNIECRI